MRRMRRLALPALVLFVAGQLGIAVAATDTLYLESDGVPQASLSHTAPTSGTLRNHDPGRDDFPGLLLQKTNGSHGETDPTKYQQWLSAPTGLELAGSATFTFWSAMKDFNTNKKGAVEAYLLDCDSAGSECVLIGSAGLNIDPWAGGSETWVQRTIDFGAITYTIPDGHSLALKLVVDIRSAGDMWFAYDAAAFPSSLTLQTEPPVTTTTTTTAPPPTTTTIAPPASTTTTTTPPTTTIPPLNTTTTTVPTTTTTVPTTTTTVPPTVSLSTSTTTTLPVVVGNEPPTTTLAPVTDVASPTTTTVPAEPVADPPDTDPTPTNEDVALGPLPDSNSSDGGDGFSDLLLSGLELVIPPSVASSLLSPLLLLESVFSAFTETGRGLLIPGLLLVVGILWTEGQRRREVSLLADSGRERT